MSARRFVVLYYVVCDVEGPSRPGQDTDAVVRFKDRSQAEGWAKGRMWQGRPAVVREDRVPLRLAQRWGCA